MRSGIDRVTRLQYRRQQLVTQTMILENQIGSLYASALQAKALYQQNMTVPYYRVQCNKAVRDYNSFITLYPVIKLLEIITEQSRQ